MDMDVNSDALAFLDDVVDAVGLEAG